MIVSKINPYSNRGPNKIKKIGRIHSANLTKRKSQAVNLRNKMTMNRKSNLSSMRSPKLANNSSKILLSKRSHNNYSNLVIKQ